MKYRTLIREFDRCSSETPHSELEAEFLGEAPHQRVD
jgi:hypothetical protein